MTSEVKLVEISLVASRVPTVSPKTLLSKTRFGSAGLVGSTVKTVSIFYTTVWSSK